MIQGHGWARATMSLCWAITPAACASTSAGTRQEAPPEHEAAPAPTPQPPAPPVQEPPHDRVPATGMEEWLAPKDLVAPSEARARAKRSPALGETAFLFVVTEPGSARIMVDGVQAGDGQAFLKVRGPRWKVVRVEAPGFEPVEGGVEVREREVVKLRVPLAPVGGRLTVVTDTPGAQVLLDGRVVGATPLTVQRVAEGVHRLVLRAGSWEWSGDIEVRPGETRLIEMTVQAATPAALPTPPRTAAESTPAAETAPPVAPAPPPVPSGATPSPAPSGPEPGPASLPPAGESPAPSTQAASPSPGRPDCVAVCKRFIQAVTGSESIREPIFNRCRERCQSGDLQFAVCAWKAKDMNDVSVCMSLPQ